MNCFMSNSFILTSFIEELPEPVVISESLGFYFDNPRCKIEIESVTARFGSFVGHKIPIPITEEQKNNDKILNFLLKNAKYSVICRYDYNSTIETENLLSNYSALICLMTLQKMEKSVFQSYLLNSSIADKDKMIALAAKICEQVDYYFPKFTEFYTTAKPIIAKIEALLDTKHKEKILYIAEILKNVFDLIDQKMILVSLVGILELLLTHNPDTKFNVEDSINKQFKLKIAVIIHNHEKKCDLEKTKKTLSVIYDLRSKIAHGDFSKLNTLIKNEYKKINPEKLQPSELKVVQDITLQQKDSILTKYNEILFKYVFYTLSTFLDDSEFVEFLKAG